MGHYTVTGEAPVMHEEGSVFINQTGGRGVMLTWQSCALQLQGGETLKSHRHEMETTLLP